MNRFEPVGDEARWRTIYALLQHKNVDDVLTYTEIGAALALHPKTDRHAIQMATRRAAQELETEDKHAIEPVRNVGYRIVEPEEHLRLARGQQTRASRALVRGKSKVENVDFNGMDPNIRKGFELMATAFTMQNDMMRRLSGRQADLEKVITETRRRGERSETEIAELRARLEALEGRQHDELTDP